jgi:hypothetical protein
MNLHQFSIKTDLLSLSELKKCKYLGYYFQIIENNPTFTLDQLIEYFDKLNLNKPNSSRLKTKIKKSKSFVTVDDKTYKLHAQEIENLKNKFPDSFGATEVVFEHDLIIPRTIYKDSRGYIVSLANQINASFEYGIYDGGAVLMRRLLEILLIHSYEHLNIENEIKDASGNYKMLSDIINDAKTNSNLGLSRNSKNNIDVFRNIGNFSAHKIYYTAQQKDIKNIAIDFRAIIEELLYKSGLKT